MLTAGSSPSCPPALLRPHPRLRRTSLQLLRLRSAWLRVGRMDSAGRIAVQRDEMWGCHAPAPEQILLPPSAAAAAMPRRASRRARAVRAAGARRTCQRIQGAACTQNPAAKLLCVLQRLRCCGQTTPGWCIGAANRHTLRESLDEQPVAGMPRYMFCCSNRPFQLDQQARVGMNTGDRVVKGFAAANCKQFA